MTFSRLISTLALGTLLLVLHGCDSPDSPQPPDDVFPESAETKPDADTQKPATEVDSGESKPTVNKLIYVKPDLTSEELRDGWVSLFDGATLFGWNIPDGTNWHVEDGCIVADTGNISLLETPFSFDNFELRCDFHLENGGNSGVFLRTAEGATNPAKDTYELNICDSHDSFPTGSIVGRQKANKAVASEGEWKTYNVKVLGNQITASIDGEPVLDFKDDSDKPIRIGMIGLQSNQGETKFRNIRLKPLNLASIFNGENLEGWRTVPGSKATFDVEEGTIHVQGGAGFLETEQTYDNFVLQMDVHTNAANVNGGLFFRAEPGTEAAPSNGYELQVHNGFADGDRRRPNDYKTGFGSGAIFRRQKARWVVANDQEWYTMTLIANGPHFASWVNGVQVNDFVDTRKADPNPRRGLRLEAGHFSLQGHDETTDVSFRNMKIVSLPN